MFFTWSMHKLHNAQPTSPSSSFFAKLPFLLGTTVGTWRSVVVVILKSLPSFIRFSRGRRQARESRVWFDIGICSLYIFPGLLPFHFLNHLGTFCDLLPSSLSLPLTTARMTRSAFSVVVLVDLSFIHSQDVTRKKCKVRFLNKCGQRYVGDSFGFSFLRIRHNNREMCVLFMVKWQMYLRCENIFTTFFILVQNEYKNLF